MLFFVHYSTDYVFDGSKTGAMDGDRCSGSAQRLRRQQTGRRAGHSKLARQVSHLPHQLGLWPARQEFLAHHAAPGSRARPAVHRRRPDRRAHNVHRSSPRHALRSSRASLAGRFGASQDWAGLYHMTCAGSVSWFGFAQAIFTRAAESARRKAAEPHADRHQRLSHPRSAPPQLRFIKRKASRPFRCRASIVAIRAR